jgi:hypothetical protein
MHSSSPHGYYISCPSHLLTHDHSNLIWRKVQIMKLLILQFSPASYYFVPFIPKILLNTLFSNTLSLCFSLNVRDQVPLQFWSRTNKIIMRHLKDTWIGTLQTGQELFVTLWEKVISLEGSRKKRENHVLWHERENSNCNFEIVFSLLSLFRKIKVDLRGHHAVCVSVYLSLNFRMPEQIFMELGMYIMAPEPISMAYFINPSYQNVPLCASPCHCWQGIGKNVTTATHATIWELMTRRFLCGPCRIKGK